LAFAFTTSLPAVFLPVFFSNLLVHIAFEIVQQQIHRAPDGIGDLVDAHIGRAVMHVAQHPQIVLAVIDPVMDILGRQRRLGVKRIMGMAHLEVRQDDAIELVGIDGIGQRPFDHMMMGFHLPRAVTVLRLVLEGGLFHAANQARQVERLGQMVMRFFVSRRLHPLVMG
jgi:hypothetical protein